MSAVYGGVETGGTWTVCALGTGPDDVRAVDEFATTTPAETIDEDGMLVAGACGQDATHANERFGEAMVAHALRRFCEQSSG